MREKAMKNSPGGKFPPGFVEVEHPPPPPPSTVEDSDILDLSMELNAASIDEVPGDLDESGIERVPNADPGFDVSHLLTSFTYEN
jgi:serine/threonine-protein phosphatase 2A regulatory subunit B'